MNSINSELYTRLRNQFYSQLNDKLFPKLYRESFPKLYWELGRQLDEQRRQSNEQLKGMYEFN
jgi:hypothetical protein